MVEARAFLMLVGGCLRFGSQIAGEKSEELKLLRSYMQ
jgi:hypothetical protein